LVSSGGAQKYQPMENVSIFGFGRNITHSCDGMKQHETCSLCELYFVVRPAFSVKDFVDY
jgi:hypothetical protein